MADRIGQQLGKYRLIRLLGKGGFAEVYLGEHAHLKTQAAIKVLHTSLEDEDVEGFLREARIVAHLKHPHIVRVFDFDVQDRTPFLVMDYLPNGNVRRLYPQGTQLPIPVIVSYVNQIASALQYAHDEKLIHRDIKPENMLLDRDNTLSLSDFGIAVMAQSSRYQNPQEVAGTAAYMAPEQFQGQPRRASDQYALAVMVYEWLSGDRPFHGSFTEIASQHLLVPPPPLRNKALTISPLLEQVVLRALEKDPHQRFASVQAFATALEQASKGIADLPLASQTPPQPVPLLPTASSLQLRQLPQTESALPGHMQSPTTSVGPTRNTLPSRVDTTSVIPGIPRQSRLTWGKAAFLVVLLLFVIGGASLFYVRGGNRNVNTGGGTAAEATTAALNARATATARAQAEATATTRAGPTATVTAAANAYATTVAAQGIMFGFEAQHTHFNPYEQVLNSSNVAHLVQGWTYPIERNSFYIIPSSPVVANGIIYISAEDHFLYALDATSGRQLWRFSTGGPILSTPAVVHSIVYFGSLDNSFYALDASSGKQIWSYPVGSYILSSPAVANGIVYFGSEDHIFYALDVQSGAKRWSYPTGNDVDSSPAVANGVVFIGSRNNSLYAFNARSGNLLWSYASGGSIFSPATVAHSIVYFGSDDHSFYALDVRSGNPLWRYRTGSSIVSAPAVVNGYVYFGSDDNTLYAFHLPSGNP